MTWPSVDQDTLAVAGAGAFASALSDGTLGAYSDEDMFDIAQAAASRPDVLGQLMGDPDGAVARLPPDAVFSQIMSEYADAVALSALTTEAAMADAERSRVARQRTEVMYSFSGLTPEEVGRAEFDKENGDPSPMLSIVEKFYQGG